MRNVGSLIIQRAAKQLLTAKTETFELEKKLVNNKTGIWYLQQAKLTTELI